MQDKEFNKEYDEIENALQTGEKEYKEAKKAGGIKEVQETYKHITGEIITAFTSADDLKDAAVVYATADVTREDGLTEHRARVITRKLMKAQTQFFAVQRTLAQSDKKNGSGLAVMNTVPKSLSAKQVIDVIRAAEYVRVTTLTGVKIENAGDKDRITVIYDRNSGIWDGTQEILLKMISWIAPHDSDKKFEEEVLRKIIRSVDGIYLCKDPNMIPMENGIVNYKTKELIPYSPDGAAFCWKRPINYKPFMEKPVIEMENGETFDIEEFMKVMMPKEENRKLLWQIIGATIRPLVTWDRAIFFYNTTGNNGKGTILSILRSLVGEGHYLSVSPAGFGKEFYLEEMATGKISNILTDEVSVEEFARDLSNFKSAMTGDPIYINRKNKTPKNVIFNGFSVFCINAPLRTADTSDSFYRRCMFLPFTAQFRDGNKRLGEGEIRDNKSVKNDYLKRPEILEWICKHVLCDIEEYYELYDTEDTLDAMADVQSAADPIRRFLEEFPLESFAWDFVPWDFAYDLYKAWRQKKMPFSKQEKGDDSFKRRYKELIQDDPRVMIKKRTGKGNAEEAIRISKNIRMMMSKSEQYINMYGLHNWTCIDNIYKQGTKTKGFFINHSLDVQMAEYESGTEEIVENSNDIISYTQYTGIDPSKAFGY